MEETYALAYDLGTGGLKASLFDSNGQSAASDFVAYDTFFPATDFQEQRPSDWWKAMVSATYALLSASGIDPKKIASIGISGHSLGAIPISESGELLCEFVPIWSDRRAAEQSARFFKKVSMRSWYNITGCGFPPACYSVFKLMWLKDNMGDVFKKMRFAIGTKDYCNMRLCGKIATDFSYASGSGVFNLEHLNYDKSLIEASELDSKIFVEPVDSSAVLGNLLPSAARELGLCTDTKVVCGGVDNSCMALGAGCIGESGRASAYMSLGSSAWIASVSDKPVLDFKYKPYVFCHLKKGFYTSATCIFSAGTSLRWIRDKFFSDFLSIENSGGKNAYVAMDELAEKSPVGANSVMFNPSLSGGSMIEPSPDIRGAFFGLGLGTSRADISRAALEGVALNLRCALDILKSYVGSIDAIPVVGGGGKSKFWMRIFADVFNCAIVKTSIDQDAASLGAAALAFKGAAIWNDFSAVLTAHKKIYEKFPDAENARFYEDRFEIFKKFSEFLAQYK